MCNSIVGAVGEEVDSQIHKLKLYIATEMKK